MFSFQFDDLFMWNGAEHILCDTVQYMCIVPHSMKYEHFQIMFDNSISIVMGGRQQRIPNFYSLNLLSPISKEESLLRTSFSIKCANDK